MTLIHSGQLKRNRKQGRIPTPKTATQKPLITKQNHAAVNLEELPEDATIRPQRLDDVIGRTKEKKMLTVLIEAAKKRNESVDHILFHGPPGLGKTTFAHVVANEMGTRIRITSGPAIERQGDLASILTNLERGDVLFIDEIHRLHRSIEEILYPAMEDFCLDIVAGKGPSARVVRLSLEPFTLIGATTRVSMLSAPLRDRFGVVQRLDYFDDDEMVEIVERVAHKYEVELDDGAAKEIALRSRGTARIAQRLFRRARDFVQVHHADERVGVEYVRQALDELGIDAFGLDELDRKIITMIVDKFAGGPVGLSTIAAAVSEDLDTVADVYEPFLIQRGLIQRTPRGRVATPKAYEHLGLDPVTGDENKGRGGKAQGNQQELWGTDKHNSAKHT